VFYPHLTTVTEPQQPLQGKKSAGLLVSTEIWLHADGKPLQPAAPCKLLQRFALTGTYMGAAKNRMGPSIFVQIKVGAESVSLP